MPVRDGELIRSERADSPDLIGCGLGSVTAVKALTPDAYLASAAAAIVVAPSGGHVTDLG